jgi:transcriptional regulator with XRE-family HTH domain
MEFGEIVRQRRQERNWNIRKLGIKSSVSGGAISKIENGHSQILVETTIRLSKSLKIKPSEFIPISNIENLNLRLSDQSGSQKYLSLQDLQGISILVAIRPITTLDRIIDISMKYFPSEEKIPPLFTDYIQIRKTKSNEELFDSLIVIINNSEYPDNLSTTIILDANYHGGAITLKDIGFFIRGIRKSHSMSLFDLQDACGIPDSTLSNIENAVYKKIKLEDVIILDKALKTNGEIISLFWNTFEFHAPTSDRKIPSRWTDQEIGIHWFIVSIYRWLQAQNIESASQWIDEIRSLQKGN